MSEAAARHEVVGFDVPTVERWLRANTRIRPPCTWTRLEGGHSNLTYLLVDEQGDEYVIRRPPEGELLPKAHDMFREFRIIDALHPVGVPVAEPIAYCDDAAVCDRHFYAMAKVGGAALYTGAQTREHLVASARTKVGESFMSVLAAIHAVDPVQVGLGELGRLEGYVQRQLTTWYGSWQASIDAADYDDPRVHRLHQVLMGNVPEQGPARVVHGDYGVHNCMVSTEGAVVAVLDWEIATLGDPLADFAYALNAWVEPGDIAAATGDPATAIPGFSTRDDLIGYYQDRTGRDLSNLAYYRSYNSLKTACILHGVYARYRRGQKSAEGVDLDALHQRIGAAIDLAGEQANGLTSA